MLGEQLGILWMHPGVGVSMFPEFERVKFVVLVPFGYAEKSERCINCLAINNCRRSDCLFPHHACLHPDSAKKLSFDISYFSGDRDFFRDRCDFVGKLRGTFIHERKPTDGI